MAETNSKYSRRAVALFWLVMVAIVLGVLIYLEQIAILYVLATLALVILLLIVGFSDLENVGVENME
jgi:heme A synthase